MPKIENVKGSHLPYFLLQKLRATPSHTFTIIPEVDIEYDDQGNPLPPEEAFRKEFVDEMEKCRDDCMARKNIKICETEEEQRALFDKIWNK